MSVVLGEGGVCTVCGHDANFWNNNDGRVCDWCGASNPLDDDARFWQPRAVRQVG